MDVQAIIAKRKRQERWGVLAAIVMAPVLWILSDGEWSDRLWVAFVFFGGFEVARRHWLWRMIARNDRRLEEIALPLGLAPNPVDGNVYEGTRGSEYVRLSIEEPRVLQHGWLGEDVRVLDKFLFVGLFIATAWLGWAWIAVAATGMLAWSWYSMRSLVVVSTSREDGTSDRQTLRRLSDVPAAIGPETLTPVEVDLLPLVPERQLQGLVSQVGTLDDESELTYVLRLIGKAGRPETLGPLLEALGKRQRPMSPRAIAAVEQAVATIRERHHLPDAGTLAFSNDDAGRLAVVREAGTLALPSRDER